MKLIIDTLANDLGMEEVLIGTLEALKELNFTAILSGDEKEIKAFLEDKEYPKDRVEILHAPETVHHEDSPTRSLRQKKDSSLVKGMGFLKEAGDGFISFGNTGAILAGGIFIVGRLKGVSRPAIGIMLPSLKGKSLILDCGASADGSVELFEQYAKMGKAYLETVEDLENPETYLLNIGEEEGKGDELRVQAFEKMKNEDYNFKGNIEPEGIFFQAPDLVIADGFSGNLFLKTAEAASKTVFYLLKDVFQGIEDPKILGQLSKARNMLDPNAHGAAPVLGTKKPVFIGHGSSNREAVKQGIKALYSFVASNGTERMAEALK